jgi:hypothetical protein
MLRLGPPGVGVAVGVAVVSGVEVVRGEGVTVGPGEGVEGRNSLVSRSRELVAPWYA